MNDITSLWNNVSKLLEIKIGKINYGTWIEPLKLIKLDEEHLMLHAPNQFTKRMIQIRFLKDIESTIRFYLKLPPEATLSVSIIEPSEEYEFNEEENNHTSIIFKNNESFIEDTDMNDEIKAELTFNNFICGKNNEFALASAKAVAENPAKEYNPLFIWGGVGLGKTHLMKACAHQIKLNNPSAKVFYFTAEKFANELIEKIQHKKMDDFRNKYRNLDILLVDDIQFIAGKKTTEEEFFNTFNELYEMHKQIIITSDKPPGEIETLEERLRSRFSMGLITGVSPPEYEVRMAILQQTVENHGYNIPKEVLDYIANIYTDDIRKLKGALLSIAAHAKIFTKNKIDLDLAKKYFSQLLQKEEKKITPLLIKEQICKTYNISMEELLSKTRSKNIAFPRQICMYLFRELTDLSLVNIANEFGRDHTTVIHGIEKIKSMIIKDVDFKETVENLIQKIKA
ncbi:replication initiator protein DnaA [Peptostreptococcaceae bacterium oral taxon 113 str. W5053]|nr:replication initiator protein DnaA [Peptostreptococcaceae bacterium oral taxon 113 str. W5053]